MTENTPEIDDDGPLRVTAELFPFGGPTKELRMIGIGVKPLILIEAEPYEVDGAEGVQLKFTGSGLETMDELVESLEEFTEALQAAIEEDRDRAEDEADRG